MVASRYDMIAICQAPEEGIPGPSTAVGNVEREQHMGDLSRFHGAGVPKEYRWTHLRIASDAPAH